MQIVVNEEKQNFVSLTNVKQMISDNNRYFMEEIPKVWSDLHMQLKNATEMKEKIRDNKSSINQLRDKFIKFEDQEQRFN
jgi:predicted fused transcriptional regulator/phosphomethylpyrimidine kinase